MYQTGWSIEHHHMYPQQLRDAIFTVLLIRSHIEESMLGALPNEIMFIIFEFLPVSATAWHRDYQLGDR